MPSSLFTFGIGLLAGVSVATVAARYAVKRSLARVRSAERRARSAERLAEVGSMTAGLAHEIKNPLSTIGLNAQLLAEGIEELSVGEEDQRARLLRRLGALRREVERLKGILTDFLTYAGELRLDRKPDDLRRLIEELVDFYIPQAQQQGVLLRFDAPPAAVTVDIDAAHIKQAVLNLMLNATQAMKAASSPTKELMLRLTVRTEADRRSAAVIHVIDTGPGITPEVRERLFQPYFTTKASGTGLGLATSRRIAEAHGGSIELATEPGKGSDFQIILPISPD